MLKQHTHVRLAVSGRSISLESMVEKMGLSNGRRKNGAWEGIIEKTSRVTNSGMNEPSEKWVTSGIRSQSLPKKLVGRNATVKVGQLALLRWSNAPIPVLIDNILWVGISYQSRPQMKRKHTRMMAPLSARVISPSVMTGAFPSGWTSSSSFGARKSGLRW